MDIQELKRKTLQVLNDAEILITGGVGRVGESVRVGIAPGQREAAIKALQEAGVRGNIWVREVEPAQKRSRPAK